MPLAPLSSGPDTAELDAPAQVASPDLPAANDGASGPKYSTLDLWAAAARQTVVGQSVQQVQLSPSSSLAGVENDPLPPIPTEMLPYKDKYIGLHTPEEVTYKTQQILQELRDKQTIGASKYGVGASLLLGLSDPVALASMAVPGMEEVGISRLARVAQSAGHAAAVGGAVSAIDEVALHSLDPTASWEGSLTNVGAGTILSGLLGAAIRPKVSAADVERLRARLQQDFDRPVASPAVPAATTDSASQIAQDVRAKLQEHVANLEQQVAAAQGIDHDELAQRLSSAQETLRGSPAPLSAQERAEAIQAEAQRLASPQSVRERLEAQYGSDLPAVLQERAEANIARTESEAQSVRSQAEQAHASGSADAERVESARAAQEELDRIQDIIRPGRAAETVTDKSEPAGYHVGEGELTDELKARFQGLRSELHPDETARAAGAGESAEPVSGGQDGGAARGAEGEHGAGHQSVAGEPLRVFRGASSELTPAHFSPEALGHATGHPSSGLGVFFANSREEAGRYGAVSEHHLDIRNPLEIASEDLPAFDSKEQAHGWAREQEAAGHDGLVIDSSHLGGPTYYVPFRREQVLPAGDKATDAVKAEAIARAPSPQTARAIGDPVLREQLQKMAGEAGWEQKGGELLRDMDGNATGRTAWIPNAEWWPGRPGGYSREDVAHIVDKAMRGERLGPKQQQLIDYMTDVADGRLSNDGYMPKPDAFEGLPHLDPASVRDTNEVAMVTRLALIDEDALDNLARHFPDDDAGFMRGVKELLDAHDTGAGITNSLEAQRVPAWSDVDGVASGGAPGETAGGRETDYGATAGEPGAGDAADPVDHAGAAASVDLPRAIKLLPQMDREAFEARLKALEPAPMISAPGDSTAGAMQAAGEFSMGDLTMARGGRVLGKALGWFAPGSRLLRSPSLETRKTVLSLLETPEMLEMNVPTPERPYGLATPAPVETLLKRWEGLHAVGLKARDELYRAYRARPYSAQETTMQAQRLTRRQFNEEVSAAMRSGDKHFIPEVQQAAQATRKIVFDPLKIEAQKVGLLPQQTEGLLQGTAESYLMRQYDRGKINKDLGGWHQMLMDGFRAQGLDVSEATDVAHKVTRNIMGAEIGLLDTNERLFQELVPGSGRLKARELLLPDKHLERYLNNDIDHLSHSYLKSLAPQVEVTRRFGDKDMADAFTKIQDEYSVLSQRALAVGDNAGAADVLGRQKADMDDLMAVRDRMYGIYGVPSDPSNWFVRASRMIRSVNIFRMLGSATWSHVPDIANVVMRHGLGNTMAAAGKLGTSLEALNLNRDILRSYGTALDLLHNSTAALQGEFGVESSSPVQKTLNRGARAFTIATLETPWIAAVKAIAGATAHNQLLEASMRAASGNLSKMERIRFNQAGVSQDLMERIAKEFATHGKTINGLRFGMTDLWHDQNAAQAVEAAVNRHAEASTLSPSKGDTPLWTSSEWGKAIFQFKTFGAVAVRKVVIPLSQGMAHGDLRAAQGLATLVAAGALTYTIKQLLSGQPIEKDPSRFGLEVLDKSNLLGWTGELFYPALWAMGAQSFSRWGDRQTWETLAGPVAGTAVDAWDLRLPAKIRSQLTGDMNASRFTRADIHRIRRMLPGNQIWYLRRAVNALESQVGDVMNLPPQAPRGSTE